MSAEVLRRAAALMRERAEGARVGRWSAEDGDVFAKWRFGDIEVAHCIGSLPEGNAANAEHIASWHPAVALAVADWLDAAAEDGSPHDGATCCHACNVARAYLGESA